MRTYTQLLFPSKKAGKPDGSCPGLFLTFILIVLITVSFSVSSCTLSHAQQIIFNPEGPFVISPLIFINFANPSDYLINLNYNQWIPPYVLNIYNFPVLYPIRYLAPESLVFYNPWGVYHRALFLPPFIYNSIESRLEYSWFLPFMQYIGDEEDIKSGIESFMEKYLVALEEAADLTPQDLVLKFPEDNNYITDLGYKVSEANFYNLVKQETGLTSTEEERINENGFVVSERITYTSFGEAYLDLFYKDMPIFISTDSILQAIHKSYDLILADLEQQVLMDKLESILSQAQAVLPQIIPNTSGIMADAYHDLNVFYTVARKLLGRHTYNLPFLGDQEVQAFLNHINQLSFEWVDIFGEERKIDFSQFKPRGHYTRSEEFQSYFRAMIWLGRIDFRVEDPRQLLAAYWYGKVSKKEE